MCNSAVDWDMHVARYSEADALYHDGELRRALRKFKDALALAPGDPDTLWAIGDCYSELGNPWKAERYFRWSRVGALREKQGDLRYNIGNALFDQRRFAGALVQYGLVPRSAKAYVSARKNQVACRMKLANQQVDTDAQGRSAAARRPLLGRRSQAR
jgi:Tfp pilus assembly protein PilF